MQNTNLSFDELTSAYTKASFNNLVGKFLFKNPLQGILLLDIDNFKYINRSRSQETGDAALTMMVGNLYKHLPKSAIIGRTGGDEFSIFLFQGTILRRAEADGTPAGGPAKKAAGISGRRNSNDR